jgi:hypothetical protein
VPLLPDDHVREVMAMARWQDFRQCPGCGFDLGTGEGERGCSWGECPYVPADLNVFCDQCRFDFYTMDGNPMCEDPMACPEGAEARSHVENYRRWQEARTGSAR